MTDLLLQRVAQGVELIDLDLLAALVLSLHLAKLAKALAESSAGIGIRLLGDGGDGITDSVLLKRGK